MKLPTLLRQFVDFSINTKLLFLSSFFIALAIATGGAGMYYVAHVNTGVSAVTDISSPVTQNTV